MIVCCPGCSTHYTHSEENALQMGRCSQCDERFPLTRPKRSYVLMPAGSAAGDPLLVAGLAASEDQVDRQAAAAESDMLPPTVEMPASPDDDLMPAPAPDADDDSGFFSADMDDDQALFGMDEDEPQPAEEAAAEPQAERSKGPAHPVREALGVFLLAGLGAAAGYHGSLQFGFEPLNAIGVGLAAGITFGWAWIRWAERKR